MKKFILLMLALIGMLYTACTKEVEVEVPVTNPVNTQLQAQVEALTNQISNLQSSLTSTQNNLDSLTGEHAELQGQYDAVVEELQVALGQIADLSAELEAGQGNIEALQAEIASLTELVSQLRAQIEDLQAQLANFNQAARVAAAKSKLVAAGYHVYTGDPSELTYRKYDHPNGNYYITITAGGTRFNAAKYVSSGWTQQNTFDTVENAIQSQTTTSTPEYTNNDNTQEDTTPTQVTPQLAGEFTNQAFLSRTDACRYNHNDLTWRNMYTEDGQLRLGSRIYTSPTSEPFDGDNDWFPVFVDGANVSQVINIDSRGYVRRVLSLCGN